MTTVRHSFALPRRRQQLARVGERLRIDLARRHGPPRGAPFQRRRDGAATFAREQTRVERGASGGGSERETATPVRSAWVRASSSRAAGALAALPLMFAGANALIYVAAALVLPR